MTSRLKRDVVTCCDHCGRAGDHGRTLLRTVVALLAEPNRSDAWWLCIRCHGHPDSTWRRRYDEVGQSS